MIDINILILSSGRRVELLQCFQRAKARLGLSGKIIAADMSQSAPALYFADEQALLPHARCAEYIEALSALCLEKRISLVVPTIDTELKILAEHKENIEAKTGAKLLISDKTVIDICRNKETSQRFFIENGFDAPRNYSPPFNVAQDDFPLFIKPKSGSSSINAFKLNNSKELTFFKEYVPEPCLQQFVEGEEYSIDAFLGFQSEIISIVPRLRIATRGGEILKGKIEKNPFIIETVRRLLNILKPIGQITLQGILSDGKLHFLEINPRFGGGAPMSILAGADSCANLYRLLLGESLSYTEAYEDGLLFLRFDQCCVLNDAMEKIQ